MKRDDLADAAAVPLHHVVRHRAARQQREVFHAVARHLEQRLEQQMLQRVVATDVDDERNARADLPDVREALVRADSDVRTARDSDSPHGA